MKGRMEGTKGNGVCDRIHVHCINGVKGSDSPHFDPTSTGQPACLVR